MIKYLSILIVLAIKLLGSQQLLSQNTEHQILSGPEIHAVSHQTYDYDQDGDLDVVLNELNGPAQLLENRTVAPRIEVRLRGVSPNTQGIGARLTVSGGPVRQTQEVISGSRYASGDDPVRVFGQIRVRRAGRISGLPPGSLQATLLVEHGEEKHGDENPGHEHPQK